MAEPDFEITRGDDETIRLTFTQPGTTTPQPITGLDVWFTLKYSFEDADPAAILQKLPADIEITDGPGGIAEVPIAAADLAALNEDLTLCYDAQVKDGAGKIASKRGYLSFLLDGTTTTS